MSLERFNRKTGDQPDILSADIELSAENLTSEHLISILENFRKEHAGFEKECLKELLDYYNICREDKGLPLIEAGTLLD